MVEMIKKIFKLPMRIHEYIKSAKESLNRLEGTHAVLMNSLQSRIVHVHATQDPCQEDLLAPLVQAAYPELDYHSEYRSLNPDWIIEATRILIREQGVDSVVGPIESMVVSKQILVKLKYIFQNGQSLAIPLQFQSYIPSFHWLKLPGFNGRKLRASWFFSRQELLLYAQVAPPGIYWDPVAWDSVAAVQPIYEEAITLCKMDLHETSQKINALKPWQNKTKKFLLEWQHQVNELISTFYLRELTAFKSLLIQKYPIESSQAYSDEQILKLKKWLEKFLSKTANFNQAASSEFLDQLKYVRYRLNKMSKRSADSQPPNIQIEDKRMEDSLDNLANGQLFTFMTDSNKEPDLRVGMKYARLLAGKVDRCRCNGKLQNTNAYKDVFKKIVFNYAQVVLQENESLVPHAAQLMLQEELLLQVRFNNTEYRDLMIRLRFLREQGKFSEMKNLCSQIISKRTESKTHLVPCASSFFKSNPALCDSEDNLKNKEVKVYAS